MSEMKLLCELIAVKNVLKSNRIHCATLRINLCYTAFHLSPPKKMIGYFYEN